MVSLKVGSIECGFLPVLGPSSTHTFLFCFLLLTDSLLMLRWANFERQNPLAYENKDLDDSIGSVTLHLSICSTNLGEKIKK